MVSAEMPDRRDEVGAIASAVEVFRRDIVALARTKLTGTLRQAQQQALIRSEMARLAGMLEASEREDLLADLREIEASAEEGTALAEGFRRMAARVTAQHRKLADLLAERTRDLDTVRQALAERAQLSRLRPAPGAPSRGPGSAPPAGPPACDAAGHPRRQLSGTPPASASPSCAYALWPPFLLCAPFCAPQRVLPVSSARLRVSPRPAAPSRCGSAPAAAPPQRLPRLGARQRHDVARNTSTAPAIAPTSSRRSGISALNIASPAATADRVSFDSSPALLVERPWGARSGQWTAAGRAAAGPPRHQRPPLRCRRDVAHRAPSIPISSPEVFDGGSTPRRSDARPARAACCRRAVRRRVLPVRLAGREQPRTVGPRTIDLARCLMHRAPIAVTDSARPPGKAVVTTSRTWPSGADSTPSNQGRAAAGFPGCWYRSAAAPPGRAVAAGPAPSMSIR